MSVLHKLSITLLLVKIVFVFWSSFAYSAEWHHYMFDYCWSGVTSLKLDSQDFPFILYDTSGALKIAHYDGFEWNYELIYGTDYGGEFSLALDNLNNPHISYHEWGDWDLMYCYWDGNQWFIELVDDEYEAGLHNSIALDSNGYPHIAYKEYIEGVELNLKYAYKDTGCWHIEEVDTGYWSEGNYCSIALDSLDHAHIAYKKFNPYPSDLYLSYAHFNGSIWLFETVDELDWLDGNTSIAVDFQGHPHIAYTDYPHAYYAHWDGSEWIIEMLEGESTGDGISLDLDSQGNPHIAFNRHLNPYESLIEYAKWNGSYWEYEIPFYINGLGQINVSLDLDSNDNPHISCDEWVYCETYYIWFGDPLTDITLDHFSAHAEGSAISLRWSVDITEGDQITGFNLYRREINNNIAAEVSNLGCIWTKVNTGLITGQNPYTYTDSDVESGVAYEYKLEAVLADDSPETLGTTQATAGLPPASFAILALYPNPASDYLTCLLALPSAGVVELTLFDISGRLVLVQQLEATEPTELEAILDVSGLASGVYTLRASSGGREVSARAVVVR